MLGSVLPLVPLTPFLESITWGFALSLATFDPITWSHLPLWSRSTSLWPNILRSVQCTGEYVQKWNWRLMPPFLDTHVSLAPTHVCLLVRWSVCWSVCWSVTLSDFQSVSVSGRPTWKVEERGPQLFVNFWCIFPKCIFRNVFFESVFSESVLSKSVFSESLISESVISKSVFPESVFSKSVFSESVCTKVFNFRKCNFQKCIYESVFSESVFSESVLQVCKYFRSKLFWPKGYPAQTFFKLSVRGGLRTFRAFASLFFVNLNNFWNWQIQEIVAYLPNFSLLPVSYSHLIYKV